MGYATLTQIQKEIFLLMRSIVKETHKPIRRRDLIKILPQYTETQLHTLLAGLRYKQYVKNTKEGYVLLKSI